MAHYIFVVNVRTQDGPVEDEEARSSAENLQSDIQSNLEWFWDVEKVTVRQVLTTYEDAAREDV
jgi:hypothetical protein